MLKLVPGISASRKNSLITGLARIDENSDELILSAYHLPEPTEFLDVNRATYYAWYYNSQKKSWGKIGELHQKNNLTYSLKKHLIVEGSGVFVTVEKKGEEPKEPGQIIISSDPELFYQELNTADTKPEDSIMGQEETINYINIAEQKDDLSNQALTDQDEVKRDVAKKPKNEDLKDLFYDLYSDLPVNEVAGLVKNRYMMLKEEVDLPYYWGKCKKYAAELSKDLELDELWEDIKADFSKILQKIDLEDLWDKVEDLIKDLVETIDLKAWIQTLKCWLKDLDIHEYYSKLKMYINAILEKVPLEELWSKIKNWLEGLLEQMDIEEIMIWIKIKIRQMRQMTPDEMKQEIQNLLKQLVDELEMPEIKIALVKVTVKDKVEQVGNFFKGLKEKMTKDGDLTPKNSNAQGENSKSPSLSSGQNSRKSPHNPFPNKRHIKDNDPSPNNPSKGFFHPYAELNQSPKNYYQPSAEMGKNPYHYGYNPSQYYPQPGAMPRYYNCPCKTCLDYYPGAFKVGADAMGKPRYFYDEEDGNYYFLTPDGQLVKKS